MVTSIRASAKEYQEVKGRWESGPAMGGDVPAGGPFGSLKPTSAERACEAATVEGSGPLEASVAGGWCCAWDWASS